VSWAPTAGRHSEAIDAFYRRPLLPPSHGTQLRWNRKRPPTEASLLVPKLRYRPIAFPKLHVVAVNEIPGVLLGRFFIGTNDIERTGRPHPRYKLDIQTLLFDPSRSSAGIIVARFQIWNGIFSHERFERLLGAKYGQYPTEAALI
jgi:hypothetical protein